MLRLWLFAVALAAAVSSRADEPSLLPAPAKAMIEKSLSFGLKRFPIGFWNDTSLADPETRQRMTEAEVESWHDAGFTVPQSSLFDPNDPNQVAHMRQMLDWAQAREMKLIVWDPRALCGAPRSRDDYTAAVRESIAQFGDHPALFGFNVGDEPNATIKDRFFDCYRTQKELAPKLHPFANLLPYFSGIEQRAGTDTWPNYLDEYVKEANADLICYDCYAQMNPGQTGWEDYFNNLRLYREAALRNGVPFWNTVLCTGHFRYRCPNQDELRWQFNTTIASGAHGVLWFFYYLRMPYINHRMAPVDELWDRTETYYNLRRVQRSFHRRYGNLFTQLASTRVSFLPKAFGGGQVFTPNDLVNALNTDEPGHPLLLGEFADREGRRYAMLVNASMTDSVKASITFPGENVRVWSWDWNGKKQEGPAYSARSQRREKSGLTIEHWLAPGQEAVYCVE